MTPTDPTPLSAEELVALRRDMNLVSPWSQPRAGAWVHVVARLLATLDARELDVERLAEALKEVTRGTWSTPARRHPDAQRAQDEAWLRQTAERIAAKYAALSETNHD